jgi:nucleoside-diphosphate-sugar epimerase
VTIGGDGRAAKDYLAAGDLHEGFRAVMECGAEGVFNLASGHVMSVNALITLVESAVGAPLLRVHAPHFPWDVECSHVSAGALQRFCGWSAGIDPVAAIRQMAGAGGS